MVIAALLFRRRDISHCPLPDQLARHRILRRLRALIRDERESLMRVLGTHCVYRRSDEGKKIQGGQGAAALNKQAS